MLVIIQLSSYCIAQQSCIFKFTEKKELNYDSYIFYSDVDDEKHIGSPEY